MLQLTATAEKSILGYRRRSQDCVSMDRLLLRESPKAAYRNRYLDLRRDFEIKHVFGNEPNKDLLVDFLSNLFGERKTINDLSFDPTERQAETEDVRKVVYDIQCASDGKEQFIIEMQREYDESFFRRLLYYAMRLGSGSVPKGKIGDDYPLPKICVVAILDYDPWKNAGRPPERQHDFIHTFRLENIDTGHPYPVALELTLVELPRFTKKLSELRTDLDKWLYAIKHLHRLPEQPSCFAGPIFDKLFQVTEYQNLTKKEKKMLIDQERELRNYANRHRLKGEAIGEERGEAIGEERGELNAKLALVRRMIKRGRDNNREIAFLVGVEENFVKQQRYLLSRVN